MQPDRIDSVRVLVVLAAGVIFGASGWACSKNEVEPIAAGQECHLFDEDGAVSAECTDVGTCATVTRVGKTMLESAQADAGEACAAAALALGAQDTWSSLAIPQRYAEACARTGALIEPTNAACELSPCNVEPVVASCTFSPPIADFAKSAFEAVLVECCQLNVIREGTLNGVDACIQVVGSSDVCDGCADDLNVQFAELTDLMQAGVCNGVATTGS